MNWSWLLPKGKGIPVLMYHKVWPGISDGLTITPEKLREQWQFLKQEGYNAISLSEYLEIAKGHLPPKGKQVLLTFDDGYTNNLTYAYPLLKEFKWQATFFIIANTLDETAVKEESDIEQKMSLAELQQIDPDIVQLALHGYAHENMGKITLEQSVKGVKYSLRAFEESKLSFYRVLAYPYGARPKSGLSQLKKTMADLGIIAAFRIGNKVNPVPAADMFEIKRIDIKGTDTLAEFNIKCSKGKLKPF